MDINWLVYVYHNDDYLHLVSKVLLEYCNPIRHNKEKAAGVRHFTHKMAKKEQKEM